MTHFPDELHRKRHVLVFDDIESDIDVLGQVGHLGKSSYTLESDIAVKLEGITEPIQAHVQSGYVMVDLPSRKTTSIPEQFKTLATTPLTKMFTLPSDKYPEPKSTYQYIYTVNEKCLDFNNHVNYSVYMCLTFHTLQNAAREGFASEMILRGSYVKNFQIFFIGEGNLGDNLKVMIWREKDGIVEQDLKYYFSITNDGGKVLSHGYITYCNESPLKALL